MSEDLKLLDKWNTCGLFKDTTNLNEELSIAKLAESIMNTSFLEVEGLDINILVIVCCVKLLKELKITVDANINYPNPKNIYDEIVSYHEQNKYEHSIKNEWVTNFLTFYKNKNNF